MMKDQMKDQAEVFAESRQYIEDHGWTQGTLRHPMSGRVCAVGAVLYSQGWMNVDQIADDHKADVDSIAKVLVEDVLHLPPHDLVVGVVGDKPPMPYVTRFTYWNDSLSAIEGRQQVLDAFAKAEKIARAGYDPDA